jgi:hypothetical protein
LFINFYFITISMIFKIINNMYKKNYFIQTIFLLNMFSLCLTLWTAIIDRMIIEVNGTLNSRPDIAYIPTTSYYFAATWSSEVDSTTGNIFFMILSDNKQTIKTPEQVNSSSGYFTASRVIPDNSGGFAIVYDQKDPGSNCVTQQIWAKYYDSNYVGGTEIQVNQLDPPNCQFEAYPTIAYTGSSYVVCYNAILQRLKDSSNFGLDGAINRSIEFPNSQGNDNCELVYLDNGNIAVTYATITQDNKKNIIYAILSESDLSIVKDSTAILPSGDGQMIPNIAFLHTTAQFVIVWRVDLTGDQNIYGQIYDISGNPVNSVFKINTTGPACCASVKSLGNIGFVVTYIVNGGLFIKVFKNDGTLSQDESSYAGTPVDYWTPRFGGFDFGFTIVYASTSNTNYGVSFRMIMTTTPKPGPNPAPDPTPVPTPASGTTQLSACTNFSVILSRKDYPQLKINFTSLNTEIYLRTLPTLGNMFNSSGDMLITDSTYPLTDIYYHFSTPPQLDSFEYSFNLADGPCKVFLTPCFTSCYSCATVGNSNNHQCTQCDTTDGFYPLVDNSSLCYQSTSQVDGYFLEGNTWKRCYISCKTCSNYPINPNIDMLCNSCSEGYYPKADNLTSCFRNLPKYYLAGGIYKKCYNMCKSCTGYPTNPVSDMLCQPNTCIFSYYPTIDNMTSCFSGDIAGYYFDGTIYQKCYSSCQTCQDIAGTYDNHQCKTCLINYYPKVDNLSSCFTVTVDNYYFEDNIYHKCYSTCLTCNTIGDFTDHLCTVCLPYYYPKIDKTTSCFNGEQEGYYFDGTVYQICDISCNNIEEIGKN